MSKVFQFSASMVMLSVFATLVLQIHVFHSRASLVSTCFYHGSTAAQVDDTTSRYFTTPAPRVLTSEESVTARFYYHCIKADPMFKLLPEAYRYIGVEIPGVYLWAQFRSLMFEHTGISVWDLWFDGDKLYVDLHSSEAILFDWGSAGSYDRGTRLNKTVASLPGVATFEILVGGERGVETSHYSFNWVAVVEDGAILRLEPLPPTNEGGMK